MEQVVRRFYLYIIDYRFKIQLIITLHPKILYGWTALLFITPYLLFIQRQGDTIQVKIKPTDQARLPIPLMIPSLIGIAGRNSTSWLVGRSSVHWIIITTVSLAESEESKMDGIITFRRPYVPYYDTDSQYFTRLFAFFRLQLRLRLWLNHW